MSGYRSLSNPLTSFAHFYLNFILVNPEMSNSNKVLNLSLKALECENPQPRYQDITCQIYKNMEYICAVKLNEANNNYQTPIKKLSSNDSIQLILRNKFSNELLGSISFDFESFLKVGKENFTQWF